MPSPAPDSAAPDQRPTRTPALGVPWLHGAALLLLPALVAWMALIIYHARGPYFTTSFTDPDYAYLLNALEIAELQPPDHTDHPGTPVQTVGAVVMRVAHALRPAAGATTLRDDVLIHPEGFLRLYQHALLGIYTSVSIAAGWLVLRSTRRLLAALLVQATPLFSFQAVVGLTRVDPEPLLLTAGVALSAGVVALLFGAPRRPGRCAVALGAVCGLGIATKVIFVPLVLVPLAAVGTMRQRFLVLVSAVAALGLSVLPMAPALGRTLRWLWSMVTHTGSYGQGQKGLADWAAYPGHLWGLASGEPLVAPIALSAAVVGLVALLAARGIDPAAGRRHRALLAVVAAQVALLLVVAKQPRAHYLVPAVSLCGLSVILLWAIAAPATASRRTRRLVAANGVAVAVIALAGVYQWRTVDAQAASLKEYRDRTLQVTAQVDAHPDRSFVRGIRTSSPSTGLHFGNIFAGQRFSEDLRRLYPGVAVWDWTGINAFGQKLSPSDLADSDGAALSFRLVATHIFDPLLTPEAKGLIFEKTAAIGTENFYTVRLSSNDADAPPFMGLGSVDGLGSPEGPYPALGLDFQVRWGTGRRTTIGFEGGAPRMLLVVEARRNNDIHQEMVVQFNGQEVGRLTFDASFEFQPLRVPLPAHPGHNELVLSYATTEHTPDRDISVLFRRLRIVPATGQGR